VTGCTGSGAFRGARDAAAHTRERRGRASSVAFARFRKRAISWPGRADGADPASVCVVNGPIRECARRAVSHNRAGVREFSRKCEFPGAPVEGFQIANRLWDLEMR